MHLGLFGLALLFFVLHGALLASLLWRTRTNRVANRTLAALVTVAALRMMPYILGYGGAYDRWNWLTFAPFDLSLAVGPLLWGYVVALTDGRRPPHWRIHLLPVAVQLAYWMVCFLLPLERKWDWYTGGHLSVVEPAGAALALLSLACYLRLSWRRLVAYDGWLQGELSSIEPFRFGWLRTVLVTTGALLVVAAGYLLFALLVETPSYLQRFPLIIAVGVFAYVVGGLGWRAADVAYPTPAHVADVPGPPTVHAAGADHTTTAPHAPDPDERGTLRERSAAYAAVANGWAARMREEGWYRDASLTLDTLAARLGTSPRTLSRALREGLDTNFHNFVNRARVDEVMRRLRSPGDGRDIMAIAFDAGFNSKASFNRVFRSLAGVAPTAYRSTGDAPGNRQPAREPGTRVPTSLAAIPGSADGEA